MHVQSFTHIHEGVLNFPPRRGKPRYGDQKVTRTRVFTANSHSCFSASVLLISGELEEKTTRIVAHQTSRRVNRYALRYNYKRTNDGRMN